MVRFFKVVQRDTLNLFVNPAWILLGLLFPLLLIAILGGVTTGFYSSSFTSFDYYGIGVLVYSTMNSATYAANSFLEEKIKTANLRIIYAPLNHLALPLAKIIATFIFTSVLYSLAGLLSVLIFKVNFGGGKLLFIWGLFLALNFLFSCLGVLACCIFKSEGVANQIISLVVSLFALFAGCFFPVASLGSTFTRLSAFSPITQFLRQLFIIIYDQSTTNFWLTLGIIIVLSLVSLSLTYKIYQQEAFL